MSKIYRKKIFEVLAILVIMLSSLLFAGFQRNVYAAGDIDQKALASAVISCYESGQFKTPVARTSLNNGRFNSFMTGGQQIYIPTSFDGNSTTHCGVFVEKLLNSKGISIPTSSTPANSATAFMAGLGYTTNSDSSSGKCVSFDYIGSSGIVSGSFTTQKICAKEIDSNGNIVGGNIEIVNGNNEYVSFANKNGAVEVCTAWLITNVSNTFNRCETYDVSNWNSLVDNVKNYMLTRAKSFNGDCGASECRYELQGIGEGTAAKINPYGGVTAEYTLNVDTSSLINGTRFLTGSTYNSKPTFLAGEQFVLYQNYLVDYFGAEVYCDWNDDEITAYSSGYKKVRLYKGGGFKTCYAKATRNSNKSVGGIDGNKHFGSNCNFDCVANWLAASTVLTLPSSVSEPGEGSPKGPVEPGGNGESADIGGKAEFDCDDILDENGGKIGAMQWILCPSLNNSAYTANWIDNLTQDMLEVKTDRYDTNSGTFKGWELVRNVANVLMIVFLMIIIISQLTGRGIDNYGIKKMLPRLIMMAILINLSFYICELVIDLSNIAGVGLRDMFGSFGNQIGEGASGGGTGFVTTSLMGVFGAFATGGGAGVAAGATAASLGVGWVAVVIGALVLVLVVIVAVVVLWLMLGVREIVIIFCVIISPLAFACFILPNTQSLFKKWMDLFKMAIIVYPICGAVGGISYMLKGISADADMGMGGAGRMILMVLPYLVFFLLPMLLKNALAALGKLGGALTSLGNTVRNGGRSIGQGAMRGVQNTEAYKNRQAEAARRRQERTSQRTIARLEALRQRREANGEKLSDRDARRLYEAHQTQNKLRLEQGMANAGAVDISDEAISYRAMSAKEAQEFKNYTDQYSNYTRAQMGNELQSAVTAYNNDRTEGNALRLQAAIATAESRGMNQEMLNYIGGYHKDDDGNDILNQPLLSLSASNANDAKILSRLSSSSNKVISQYGIQMSKPANVGQTLSMGDFASSTGPVRMSEAFENKGPAILNNMDDDTLEYINKRGGSQPVVSSAMLANAAASTTNQKELRQINDMFSKMNSDNISFSGKQLANFDNSTIQTLMSRVKPNSKLQENFVVATNDIERSPELMGTLRPEQREMFNAIRRGAGVGEM